MTLLLPKLSGPSLQRAQLTKLHCHLLDRLLYVEPTLYYKIVLLHLSYLETVENWNTVLKIVEQLLSGRIVTGK